MSNISALFGRVGDCCLTPSEQCFSSIRPSEWLLFNAQWVMYQLYHVAPLGNSIAIPSKTSLCSFYLMQCAYWRTNQPIINIIIFYLTRQGSNTWSTSLLARKLTITPLSWTLLYSRQEQTTVKPVLRGHLWDKEKVAWQDSCPLKEVQFIWFFYDKTKKVTF